jgi:4-alpha-glucanotransferase
MRAAREHHTDSIERTRVTQFLFQQQWLKLKSYANQNGVQFFGDMPIYIALDSADAWVHGELLEINRDGVPSAVAGVPPDYFSEDGQLWGNPLYDWAYHARTGYRWWVERVRHACRQSDLVRIDHFRGFEAYWAVPWGAETARQGEWRPGPCDALFEAIEERLGRLPIVAEDLGVITPAVDALRLRHGIPGMVVLQFDIADPDFDVGKIEENSVCYTGTHDNDTTVGWFRGSNDDTLTQEEKATLRAQALKHTGGSPETIHHDMIRLAFASKAALAVAPMQDFLGLGSEARFNIPGTTMDNWRWRLGSDDLNPAFCESIAEMVQEGRRG